MTGWGILATGGIAHAFTSDLRTAGSTVAAVGSRRLDAARDFAAEFEIPRAHGSYEQLVADPTVDIVYIASPHSHHLEHAALALENGKHVLIEKPIALDGDQAIAIRDLAADRGLLAMEAMWTRYLPHMVRIREILAAGTLGQVRFVSADHSQRLPTDPEHRLNALELGGGALLDLGVYPMSFIREVAGPPREIRALGKLGPTGADTDVAVAMVHDGDVLSTFTTSSRAAGPVGAQIVGTAARIEIDRTWYAPTSFRVIDADGAVVEEFDAPVVGRGMQYQARYAEQLLAAGRTDSDVLSLGESIQIMRCLDEVRAQIGVAYPRQR